MCMTALLFLCIHHMAGYCRDTVRDMNIMPNLVDEALSIAMNAMRMGLHSILGSSPGSLVFNRDKFLDIFLIAIWHAITQKREHLINKNLMRENQRRRRHDCAPDQKVQKKKEKLFKYLLFLELAFVAVLDFFPISNAGLFSEMIFIICWQHKIKVLFHMQHEIIFSSPVQHEIIPIIFSLLLLCSTKGKAK